MNVTYQSTRSAATKVTASQAILKGLADDGGLFVPDQIPQLDVSLDQILQRTSLSPVLTVPMMINLIPRRSHHW